MKDTELFESLNMSNILNNLPFYCGEWEAEVNPSINLYGWESYGKGYTPSSITITCPLLEDGQFQINSWGNTFTKKQVTVFKATLKKCLDYYKGVKNG